MRMTAGCKKSQDVEGFSQNDEQEKGSFKALKKHEKTLSLPKFFSFSDHVFQYVEQ